MSNLKIKAMNVKFQIPVTMDNGAPKININALLSNQEFQECAVEEIASELSRTGSACVVFLSYRSDTPLSRLVNLLAEKHHSDPQPLALVTKTLKDFFSMRYHRSKDVLLVKKVFHNGKILERQIQELRKNGFTAHVLCLTAHSSQDVQNFARQHDVDIKAVLKLDELAL